MSSDNKTCYWYRQGYCASPKLSKMADFVTSKDRCLEGGFRMCIYYLPPPKQKQPQGLENFSTTQQQQQTKKIMISDITLAMSEVYKFDSVPSVECPYFTYIRHEADFYAYCDFLQRLLTREIVKLCSSYYLKCPWYNMGNG